MKEKLNKYIEGSILLNPSKLLKKKVLNKLLLASIVITTVYISSIESVLYKSTTTILIKDSKEKSISLGLLSGLGGQASSGVQDSVILQNYLESLEIFNQIDKEFDMKTLFSSDKQDFVSRVYSWNTIESYLNLYKKRLSVVYDPISSIITISYLDTEPEFSKKIVDTITKLAEEKLNIYENTLTKQELEFINSEKEKYKKILDNHLVRLEAYQNKNKMLSPEEGVESVSAIIEQLSAKLVEDKIKLNKISVYQKDESYDIINLKEEIKNTEKSIEKISNDRHGDGSVDPITNKIYTFKELNLNVAIFSELYTQTLLQEQQALVEHNKNNKRILVLTKPMTPENYSEPRKLRDIIKYLLIFLFLYGILSLLLAIIKDHKE